MDIADIVDRQNATPADSKEDQFQYKLSALINDAKSWKKASNLSHEECRAAYKDLYDKYSKSFKLPRGSSIPVRNLFLIIARRSHAINRVLVDVHRPQHGNPNLGDDLIHFNRNMRLKFKRSNIKLSEEEARQADEELIYLLPENVDDDWDASFIVEVQRTNLN